MDIITKSMKVGEIKKILRLHGIDMPYMWELALNMVFTTLETDKLEVIGFGSNAKFKAIDE